MIPNHVPKPQELSVLIVDDEPRLREVLVRAIASWGFRVAGAHSGERALQMMAATPFDISILDLDLPAMAGIELFQKLRELWPLHQVIILTGFGDLESARAAIRLDVVDFLKKPCPLSELEQALYRASQRLEKPPEVIVADEPPPAPPAPPSGESTLEAVERDHILATLRRHHGNRTATAAELEISRRTLHSKLAEYAAQGFDVSS